MITFLKDLLEYNHYSNEAYIKCLTENTQVVSKQSVVLLSHILNVHKIWNYKMVHLDSLPEPWYMNPSENFININTENFELSCKLLKVYPPDNKIHWQTRSKEEFDNDIKEIIFQIINHSSYHRAQIAKELVTMSIIPPVTDYIFYKMNHKNNE